MKNAKLRSSTILNFKFPILNSRRGGFTLLELILSITILIVVTIIIGSGFRLGVKAWERGEWEANETQRLRAVSGLMSQQLKSAYPYEMELNGEKVIIFQGESSSLLFVTTLTGDGGVKWVRYSFKDGALLFKEGRLPDKKFEEEIEKTSEDEEVIDRDITEFKFEYLSNDGEWEESWEFGKNLPKAVRVKLTYFHPFLITIPMGLEENGEQG